MKMFLLLFLVCSASFAQTTSSSLPASAPANTSQSSFSIFSLDNLKTKFKINYFSETVGPTIAKWDDNEYSDAGTKNREPMTMYHSLNVRYIVTERFNVFMSPRFSTVIGDRNDLRATQEQNVFYSDDWQFGVFYTFVKTPTFQYNNRFTHREPFSRKSRFENINSQIEWQHDITWMPAPAVRIIHWNNYRYYAYNNESTEERFRINFTTLVNYTWSDKWNTQFMHNLDLQHRNPKDSDNRKHRDMNFMKRNTHNLSFGQGYSPIPSLTFIPFIRLMDERNIRNETTIVGLWMLGKIL
jgi:hypothetical protein